MAKKQMPRNTRIAVALSPVLEALACEFAGALTESVSLSAELGRIVRDAGKAMGSSDEIGPFVDGCKQLCEAAGLTEGSFKVYLSNARGVLRAMLEQGYEPAGDMGLRAMYDGRPESGTNPRKARQPGTGKDKSPKDVKPVPATKADLIRALFGFHTAELEDCVQYAVEHSGIFQTWAKASAKAAQTVTPLRKAA